MSPPAFPVDADAGLLTGATPLSAVAIIALVLGGATAALAVYAALRARAEQRALKPLVAAPLQRPLNVVIPARNEADRLPATLAALLADPAPGLRVVVVDDASTDGTAAVVKRLMADEPRLSLLRPTWPPTSAHLFGKPRALHAAISALPVPETGALDHDEEGELVLCLDADVVLGEGALGGLVNALGDAAAVSVAPALECRSLSESLLVPAFVAVVGVTHPPSRVQDPASTTAFLNGQLILLRRRALDEVGGFASVADTVLEDVALARRLKAAGQALSLLDGRRRDVHGRPLVQTRMYDDVGSVLLGFSKNARALHGAALPRLAVALMVIGVLPWLAVGVALTTATPLDDLGTLLAWGVTTLCAASNRHALGGAMWPALVSPLVQLTVGGTLLWAHLRRQGRWRGRTFST